MSMNLVYLFSPWLISWDRYYVISNFKFWWLGRDEKVSSSNVEGTHIFFKSELNLGSENLTEKVGNYLKIISIFCLVTSSHLLSDKKNIHQMPVTSFFSVLVVSYHVQVLVTKISMFITLILAISIFILYSVKWVTQKQLLILENCRPNRLVASATKTEISWRFWFGFGVFLFFVFLFFGLFACINWR